MAPRGIRNNNPGNIEYGKFARSMGATGSDGRFAKFSSPEEGIRAIVALQQRYEKGGRETLFERISRWAPASDNNDVEAYANALGRKMGIDINTPFSINDPVLGPAFIDGMIQHENGRQPYTAAQIQSGHGLAATGSPGLTPTGGIADVAALNPPPDVEVGSTDLQGFAPNLPDDPAQAAIAENFGQSGDLTADQIDELTRTDVAGNYLNPLTAGQGRSIPLQLPPQWTPATGFPPPPPRRPGPGGALGVDLGMQPAGMPVPPSRPYNGPMPSSRPGNFDWMGGGAPAAGMVPTPGTSPLRPATGGPNDRRPQPPMPPGRYPGFDFNQGPLAPAAGAVPVPPMRPAGAAAAANMPGTVAPQGDDRVAAIQGAIDQGVTNPSAIWGVLNMDRDGNLVGDITQAEIQTVLDRGQYNPPNAQAAIADAFGPGIPLSQAPPPSAPQPSGLTGGPVAGRPEYPGQVPGAAFQTPYGGRPEAAGALPAAPPPPLPTWDANQSRLQSDALARDLGFNRRQMEGLTQPPPSAASVANMPGVPASGGPDFNIAAPSPMLPPSWSPATSFPGETLAMGANEEPVSGVPGDLSVERFYDPSSLTYQPKTPLTTTRNVGLDAFNPALTPGAPPMAPPTPKSYTPFTSYGGKVGDFTAAELGLPDTYGRPTVPTQPAAPTFALRPGQSLGLPEETQTAADITGEASSDALAGKGGSTTGKKDLSTAAKIALSFLGPVGMAIAAVAGKGGSRSGSGTGFGAGFAPATYTPYGAQSPGWVNGMMSSPTYGGNLGNFRTSGSAPYGNQGKTTNWTSGTSNALGGSGALQWTGSNGQTITAYTDPNTGQTFHSFS